MAQIIFCVTRPFVTQIEMGAKILTAPLANKLRRMTVVIQQSCVPLVDEENNMGAVLTINPGTNSTTVKLVDDDNSVAIETGVQFFKRNTMPATEYNHSLVNFMGKVTTYMPVFLKGLRRRTSIIHLLQPY